MKIFITGADGQVGKELVLRSQKKNYEFVAFNRHSLDITDQDAVEKALKKNYPSVVINAAAYTAVDNAERKNERKRVFEVNRDGPLYLAASCAQIKASLIHISTDYVFSGEKQGSYSETDKINPTTVYGTSKAAGEQAIREALGEHVIIRTSWVFGTYGHNFVKTMLRLGHEKEVLRVVNDQYGCPTYAGDIAETLLTIASHVKTNNRSWGTYHYCGKEITTWYGFAQTIFEIAQKYTSLKLRELVPVRTDEYPTPAVRPHNSALDCTHIKQTFNISPTSWKIGLSSMIEAMYFENR